MHSLSAASAFENWQVCGPAHSNQHKAREGNSTHGLTPLCPQLWHESSSMKEDRGHAHGEWASCCQAKRRILQPAFSRMDSMSSYLSQQYITALLQNLPSHGRWLPDKRHALKATFRKASNLKSLTSFVFYFFLILASFNLHFQAVSTEGIVHSSAQQRGWRMSWAVATGLCKSVLGTGVTGLMWKPIWWVAVPTSEFLRGSVVSLKARSDLAQLTPLPSDYGWDVRKSGLV